MTLIRLHKVQSDHLIRVFSVCIYSMVPFKVLANIYISFPGSKWICMLETGEDWFMTTKVWIKYSTIWMHCKTSLRYYKQFQYSKTPLEHNNSSFLAFCFAFRLWCRFPISVWILIADHFLPAFAIKIFSFSCLRDLKNKTFLVPCHIKNLNQNIQFQSPCWLGSGHLCQVDNTSSFCTFKRVG